MKAYRPSEVVVNNTLFIDKTENAVGINTMTPKANLDVIGKIQCSDDLSVGGSITGIGNLTATGSITASGNVTTSGLISATGNITSSGNVGIGVTSPTNRLNIASDVPYANLTSLTSLRTTAQLHIKQATGTGSLYIANGYTGGVGTGSVIQTSDYYSSADHGTTLFLNPLGGNVNFGNGSVTFGGGNINLGSGSVTFSSNTWHRSSDGHPRFYFVNNGEIHFGSGNGRFTFRNVAQTVDTIIIDNAGNFTAVGNITASGNVTAYSDARVKTNIVEIDYPLEKIKNMRGVYYNRIDDSNASTARHVGLIAQEVERVLPEVVLTDTSEEKHKSVAYGNIVALLIEGMKAQQSTIEGMQAILFSIT
jgi:hypothetical protein